MKITVIGAGSYVFGPSVLAQALLEHEMDGIELALMDVDAELVTRMAGVGRRMARERGLTSVRVTAHAEREPALDGADFVLHSASPQMQRRHAADVSIIQEHAPGHVVSEFGGVAGISYSLRQIAFVDGLADDILRHCPDAWLLAVANPLPRVCQAAHERGVTTVGFCVVASVANGMVWKLLHGAEPRWPYAQVRERYAVSTAGVNHLGFVLEARERATGEDVLPRLRAAVEAGAASGNPRAERLLRETGYLLTPTDEHTRDFFAPHPGDLPAPEASATWHGSAGERAARLDYLRAVADGEASWEPLLERQAWERPLDLIASLRRGEMAEFSSLNLANEGQVPELPHGVFVETPARASGDGLAARTMSLPHDVAPYCQRTVAVTQAIVRAARTRRRAAVYEAADLDPTITDKEAGRRALDACLAAHADLLPAYS